MRAAAVTACLLILAAAFPAAAAESEEDWLPARVEQGAVEQLAARLAQAELGPDDAAGRRRGAQAVVDGLRTTLEGWGTAGVLERAPTFPGLGVPAADERHLDAMVRYQICTVVLVLQLRDPEMAADLNLRLTGVLGLTAMTLAEVYLRRPFVAAGGDPDAIEATLTDPGLQPVLDRLQSDAEARRVTEARCQPVVVDLLTEPIERLGALAPSD